MHLMWFRHDLRGVDNPALQGIMESKEPVIAVYVHAPGQMERQGVGLKRQWFHLQHVANLFKTLSQAKIFCIYREAHSFSEVPDILDALMRNINAICGLSTLSFTREVGVWEEQRDSAVRELCAHLGVTVNSVNDDSILPPGYVRQKDGAPYKVFTPFKKAWYTSFEQYQLPVYDRFPSISLPPQQILNIENGFSKLEARLQKLDKNIDVDFKKLWPIGEIQAQKRLDEFKLVALKDYADQRDLPALSGTSQLSPYLASGVVSARSLFLTAQQCPKSHGRETWLSELIWRDFYRQVMLRFPQVSKNQSFNIDYDQIKWRRSEADLEAWKQGQTGVPLVDAGMRQLNQTGWMHNRVRMVTAMFLSKNLFLDWRLGEQYFMQQLIDGDFASNNGGWQWSASVGTDAAPYFRVFNPFTQAERFDPECRYIRKFVPELANAETKMILKADQYQTTLQAMGYAGLIVNVKTSRKAAIEAFKSFKTS